MHHTHTPIGQVDAVKQAFQLVYPETALRVEGVEVESGVSCQVG